MAGERTLWPFVFATLMVLLVGLGCSICPVFPQPPDVLSSPSPRPSDTPGLTPEPTSTPEPTPTPEPPPGVPYANPAAGFSILYPAGWVYQAEARGASFAESEEALLAGDPSEAPIFIVFAGVLEDIEHRFGAAVTAQDLLDDVLGDLRQEEAYEIGETEPWSFGDTSGVGVEVQWVDSWTGIPVHGYLIAAVGDEVAGVGLGVSSEDDWAVYGPVFLTMFGSLEFFPPEVPEPVVRGPIQSGETVQGTLPFGGAEVWTFDAQQGQYVTIRLDAADPDSLDPYLELYNADGLIIAEDDDGGEGVNARILDFPVVASGTYSIHTLTYSGEGDYSLGLEVTDEPSAGGTIEYGQTVEEVLAEDVEHGWFFEGSEGDVVNIAMNVLDEGLDCYLELYGPDGLMLTYDDDSGEGLNALIEYYELPADGTYRVVARGVSFDVAGPYELTLEQTEMVVEGVLTYNEVVSATLKSNTRHHWLFEGEAGDVVTISMTALTEQMDTYLELFAPDGVRVMTDDDSGGDSNAEIFAFELPLSGTYRIIARGYGDEDAGDYRLALTGP